MLKQLKLFIQNTARLTGGTILLVILLPVGAFVMLINYLLRWRLGAVAPKSLRLANFLSRLNNNVMKEYNNHKYDK